jgi:hypothetical protein
MLRCVCQTCNSSSLAPQHKRWQRKSVTLLDNIGSLVRVIHYFIRLDSPVDWMIEQQAHRCPRNVGNVTWHYHDVTVRADISSLCRLQMHLKSRYALQTGTEPPNCIDTLRRVLRLHCENQT